MNPRDRNGGGAGPVAVFDPVGRSVIDALVRRAEAQPGNEARQFLLQRVETLRAERAAAQRGASQAAPAPDQPTASPSALAGLSELVDRLGRAPAAAWRTEPHPVPARAPDAVTAFKGTWSRLRADQRLRQAVTQVPAMAGPLNSSRVINRTLQMMRDLSPEYLDAFMLHVDTLQWLEQASGGGSSLASRAAAPAEGRRTRKA